MAFTIQHGQSAAILEALARAGGAIGERQGRETARQQGVQEAAQQTQLDQGQQRIDQGNRQIDAQFDLENLRQSGDMNRLDFEYQRRAQEVEQRNVLERQAEGRQLEHQTDKDLIQRMTPERAREYTAILREEGRLRGMIGSQISLEQAAIPAQELLDRKATIVNDPSSFQQPLTPEQVRQQTAIFDHNGHQIGAIGENGPEYFVWANSEAGQTAERDAKLRELAISQATTESVSESGTVTKVFDANLALQIYNANRAMQQASSIAPGESGGIPTGGDPLRQAAQALGIDLSQPATPEASARLQAYMQQGGQGAAPQAAPVQQQPEPPDEPLPEPVVSMADRVEQAINSGMAAEQAVDAAARELGAPAVAIKEIVTTTNREAQQIARALRVPYATATRIAFENALRMLSRGARAVIPPPGVRMP